jgi:hypothetical protein
LKGWKRWCGARIATREMGIIATDTTMVIRHSSIKMISVQMEKGERMYESPIEMISEDIIKDIVEKQNGYLIEIVHRLGFDVNEEEIKKALTYDRNQWERGYADGRMDGYHLRDTEIVRCKDCKHRPIKGDGNIVYAPNDINGWDDETCPCLCEDCYYNWMPEDDFFCGKGERRNDATLH